MIINLLLLIGAAITGLIGVLYLWYQSKFKYWRERNIKSTSPKFPFGDFGEATFTKTIGVVIKEIYDEWKSEPYVGFYSFFKPILLVNDLEMIKNIMVRDFMSFHDRGLNVDEENDPLSAHLFSLGGTAWRNLRVKLTPTFTSGKMKMMFHTLVKTGDDLKEFMDPVAAKNETIEMKDILARFTTDIISSCAFGIESSSLQDPNSIFRVMGRKVMELSVIDSFVQGLNFVLPDVAKLLKIRTRSKEVEKFFLNTVKDTIAYREQNNIKRNDFMQLLIELKNKGYVEDVDADIMQDKNDNYQFTLNLAAAQAFVFFIAGFETSSTTMQFCLYELALNPDIQDKTRASIDKVLEKHGGKITYDSINDMVYLERVIQETLRKYPPVPLLSRECSKDYKIEGTKHIIEKGVQVQIPVFGIQRDPRYFPEPEKFDPDRFSEEGKARNHFSYLPFGEGPRVCIGLRFGMMQTKVGLSVLLSNYKFSVAEKTCIPMEFDSANFILAPKGGMHLTVSRR